MNCEHVQTALIEGNALSTEETRHLEDCEVCGDLAKLLVGAAAGIGAEPDNALDERILLLARVRAESELVSAGAQPLSRGFRLLLTAAAALVTMLCLSVVIGQELRTQRAAQPPTMPTIKVAAAIPTTPARTEVVNELSFWDEDVVDRTLLEIEAEFALDSMATDAALLGQRYD